jgi:hypothetical protein
MHPPGEVAKRWTLAGNSCWPAPSPKLRAFVELSMGGWDDFQTVADAPLACRLPPFDGALKI